MAFNFDNRIQQTVSGTGTGNVQLLSTVPGFKTFENSKISAGDTVPYVLVDGTSYEVGYRS